MFDYSLLHWSTFVTAVVLLELSPGADMAFMLGRTASNGRKAGFAALFGSLSATLLHAIMAAVGLSAVLATSALAFTIVKWAGAAYLIWLGLCAFRSKSSIPKQDEELKSVNVNSIYIQGALITALNPKVAIFFLAFLPQFVVEGAGPVSLQLMLHGSLIAIIGLITNPPLILAGSRIASSLRKNRHIQLWMERGLGALFIGLGVRLGISERV